MMTVSAGWHGLCHRLGMFDLRKTRTKQRTYPVSPSSGFWLIALVAACIVPDALGITIVSTDLRVSGGWSESWTDKQSQVSDSTSGWFEAQSSNGADLSGNWSSLHGWASGQATLSPWYLQMNGTVHAGSDISVTETVDYSDLGMFGSATTRFFPGGTRLKLDLDGLDLGAYTGPDFPESFMRITLTDLTSSETLLETDYWRDFPTWIEDYYDRPLFEYEANPLHLYEFKLEGGFGIWAGSMDAGDLRAQAEIIDIPAVPDQASGWLLVALSLWFVRFIERGAKLNA